jgi:dienelactone hydrolase
MTPFLLPLLLTGAAGTPFDTPQEVWQDFDPRRDPLEVEVKRQWTEAGVAWREFYFTGETIAGQPVRVYAMYAAPEGAKGLPAILHIHGGGQTVYPSWLAFWTQRGYAAMSFNWGGRWENRAEFTKWGGFKEGNHLDARTGPVVHPDQHASCWYHWALLSRRCLTYLEQQPEVDAQRLGIFGVSMGGTLVWPVAAMDPRVKAACAVYGNGWDSYPPDVTAPDPQAANPDVQLWRRTMEAEAYAPLIRCPILFLSATDDQHGRMDRTDALLAMLPGPVWQSITPNQRHHVAPEQGRALPLFMETVLKGGPAWPKNPGTLLSLGEDGVPRLHVMPDAPDAVTRVEVWYALAQTNPMARHWRVVEATKGEARLPIVDAGQRLYAFANVHHANGLCLTSKLSAVMPAELGAVKATDAPSLLIDDFTDGFSGWVRPGSYTDPDHEQTYLRLGAGPDGRQALIHDSTTAGHVWIGTHKIADPKWQGPDGAALVIEVLSKADNTLTVSVTEHEFLPGMKVYAATVTLPASPQWQTVTLHLADMKTDKGEALAAWSRVTNLELRSETWRGEGPTITGVRWVR